MIIINDDFNINKIHDHSQDKNEHQHRYDPFKAKFLKGPLIQISGKVYSQVGLDEICFQLDKDPNEIIQPLNEENIQKLYESNGTSLNSNKPDLILYLLNHNEMNFFDLIEFERFQMHLWDHKYIICDFCYSGSIIHLIKLSQALDKLGIIFSMNNDLSKKLFYLLTIIPFSQDFSSYELQLKQIKRKAAFDPFTSYRYRFDIISQDNTLNVHEWLEIPQIPNKNCEYQTLDHKDVRIIQRFIEDLPSSLYNLQPSLQFCYENNIQINPFIYLSLSENSTIICSSFIKDKSYSLPLRRLEKDKLPFIVRSFGNLSTSIYLNAFFFDPITKITNDSIIHSINKSMEEYRSTLLNIILQQMFPPFNLKHDSSQ